MANRNLELPPQMTNSTAGFTSSGPPGVNAAALARLGALRLPPGPRQAALAKLAAVLAKLPPTGGKQAFLP